MLFNNLRVFILVLIFFFINSNLILTEPLKGTEFILYKETKNVQNPNFPGQIPFEE